MRLQWERETLFAELRYLDSQGECLPNKDDFGLCDL